MVWFIDDGDASYEVPDNISQNDNEAVYGYLQDARSLSSTANNNFAQTGQYQIPLDTPATEQQGTGVLGVIKGILSGEVAASDVGQGIWDTVTNLDKTLPKWAERVNSDNPQEREQAILEAITTVGAGGMASSGAVGGAGTAGMFIGQSGRMENWVKDGFERGVKLTDTDFNKAFEDIKKEYMLPGKDTLSPVGMDLAKDKMWKTYKAEQGIDGGWRTEVPDDVAKFRARVDLQFQKSHDLNNVLPNDMDASITRNYSLSDLIEHDEVFKAYPEFKDYKVEFTTDPRMVYGRGEGQFNPNENTIQVAASTPREAKSILMHEIQHGIQYKEKWAEGGNSNAINYLADHLRAERDVYDKALKSRKSELTKLGKNLDDDAEYSAYLNARKKVHKNVLELSGWKSQTKGIDKPAYDVYHRLLGEIEARNVQRRMNSDSFMQNLSAKTGLTPEELRVRFRPSETTDVNTYDSKTFLYKNN